MYHILPSDSREGSFADLSFEGLKCMQGLSQCPVQALLQRKCSGVSHLSSWRCAGALYSESEGQGVGVCRFRDGLTAML